MKRPFTTVGRRGWLSVRVRGSHRGGTESTSLVECAQHTFYTCANAEIYITVKVYMFVEYMNQTLIEQDSPFNMLKRMLE